MRDDVDNAVDNQLADAEQGNRQQSAEKPDENSTSDNRPPGLPHDLQHRRNLAERRQTFAPPAPETMLAVCHRSFLWYLVFGIWYLFGCGEAGNGHPIACTGQSSSLWRF
jgi:hypothetical protein